MRNVLIIQAILILAGVAVSRFYQGDAALLPAFYGGAIALAKRAFTAKFGGIRVGAAQGKRQTHQCDTKEGKQFSHIDRALWVD